MSPRSGPGSGAVGARAEALTVCRGDVVAVRDLTFTAAAGEVTCLVGPNGAGKTSTVETLEGFLRPSEGRVTVLGLDPAGDHRRLAGLTGVMLQEVGIHPAIRVGEAVRHAAALYPRSRRPGELLEQVGLAGLDRRTFRQLSGGEQRRLALALALVGRPEVVFLDEPTAGVDPAGRVAIRDLVAGLRAEGVTVLLCSHELDEVERLADRVVMIHRGAQVAGGTVADLTRGSQGAGALRFRARPGLDTGELGRHLAVELGEPVRAVESTAGEYLVDAPGTPALVASLTAWLAARDVVLGDLRAGHRTLEDVFLDVVGRPGGPVGSGEGT